MKSFFLLSIACLLTITLSQALGDGQKNVNDIVPLNSNLCNIYFKLRSFPKIL